MDLLITLILKPRLQCDPGPGEIYCMPQSPLQEQSIRLNLSVTADPSSRWPRAGARGSLSTCSFSSFLVLNESSEARWLRGPAGIPQGKRPGMTEPQPQVRGAPATLRSHFRPHFLAPALPPSFFLSTAASAAGGLPPAP